MKKLGLICLVVGVLGLALWYFWGEFKFGSLDSGWPDAGPRDGPDTSGMSVEDVGDREVVEPNLDRLVFGESVSADERKRLGAEMQRISAALKTDPESYDSWLDLASYRKLAGDFVGAEEIWLYMAALWPDDRTAHENLGDLYHLYVRDYPRAETFYRAALRRDDTYPELYRKLHELYALSWAEKKGLADDILLEGLDKVPRHVGFLFTLAEYYAREGEVAKAKEYYREVRILAANAGDTKTVERVDEAVEILGTGNQ